ncbi:MAG: type II secretion system protein N [Gammaproteobacteria bacterium]|nr:type II secretion system protein N [Gammaproteobacteria bacterium]MDH5735895.1 type II secretion system protein N [Gammaproteobacteria bacterium]
MKIKYYVLIAIFSYLLFTIASIPAATAFSLLKDNSKLPFSLQGIGGSIWNGHATRVIAPSAPPIENLSWSLNPFSLLLAQISANIETDILKNKITGNITIKSSGNIYASDIKTTLKGSTVQQLIKLPLGEMGGDITLDIDSAEFNPSLPLITGMILWNKATFTLADTVNLGNIEITLKPSDTKTLTASIKNKGGDISIEGKATLADNKAYTLDLTFKPQESANNNIKQSLAMFARRQTNGTYLLKQNGNLRSLGF